MTENRWAKLPEPHRALINYAAAVMREKFPPKSEDEYRRAESRLATSVRSYRRGPKRFWTLVVPELGLKLQRAEVLGFTQRLIKNRLRKAASSEPGTEFCWCYKQYAGIDHGLYKADEGCPSCATQAERNRQRELN